LNVCKTIGQVSGDKGKTGTDDLWCWVSDYDNSIE
jgi:hypothetical protein